MKSSRILIKLGGASLQDETVLTTLTEALIQLRKYNYQVILVHGGGPAINAELTRRGITWNFLQGQRITTPEMMGVIESVLCGDVNRKLVRHLSSHGVPAVGLSGADGQTLLCKAASQELGQVGAIQEVMTQWIEGILKTEGSPVPVIAPIGVGAEGEAYNINADWAASHLASALKAEYLIFLTDQSGILNLQKNLIEKLTEDQLQTLVNQEVVTGGMLTKTRALQFALKHGVKAVRVMNTKDSVKGVWSDQVGTWCVPDDANSWEGVHYAAV
ncbi:MAG: acetylglutamate kinase [Pseudobdellovibrionaceae bacterium]